MPNRSTRVDDVFKALADPTRRAVIERLGRGPASTTDLARPFDMALPSFAQHLDRLEASGLVASRKTGRVRTYRLVPRRLLHAAAWLDAQRPHGENRPEAPDALVTRRHAKGRSDA